MTERELLELAAKAAGLDYRHEDGEIRYGDASMKWNPLTNDGAALRLAVKLRIEVRPVYMWKGPWDDGGALQDPYAATRLAIVRAAAEIGRKM